MSSSGSRYERLPVIHERSSLFRAVDRIEVSESDLDEGAVREPHSRRNSSVVTTAADAEGNVHAFVLDEADQGDYDDERVSLWERFRSWLESNTFVILCLIVALVANAFADKLGYTRATLATPAVFACASIVFDVIEPILFGSISVVSGCLPFKVLVVVASLQTHLHRIALSVVLTVWLEMIERHSDHLLNCMRALTFALVLNLLKDIIMHIVRRSITIRAVLDDIQESDLERDAMVMLCCPDNAARLDERRRWRSDQKRRSLNSKLEAISEGTLDLPLRPLTITDVQQWRYSSETVVRIGTVQQMRVIAAVLRDHLFENGRKQQVDYTVWRSLFGSVAAAEKTWQTMFGLSPLASQTISQSDFVWGVYQAFERRKRLTAKMLNISNLFTLMSSAVNVVYGAIALIAFLFAFDFELSSMLVTAGTTFAAIGFALSGTITRTFESIVFIFVTQAFEVGDRVTIDGEDFFVHRIHLLTTELRRPDNRVMQISNGALSGKAIYNHRRTGPAKVSLKFMIAYDTTSHQMHQLKTTLRQYVKLNSDIWKPDVTFSVGDHTDDTALVLTASFEHRLTWQDRSVINENRFDLAECLRATMKQLDISTSGSDSIVYQKATPFEA